MAPDMYERASILYQRGDLSQAAALCARLLESTPQQPEASYLLGLIRAQQGDVADAIALIDGCLKSHPDSLRLLMLLGSLLQMEERIEDALCIYDRVLAIAPDEAEIWSNRGGALQSAGRLPEALESLDRALAVQPDHAGALYNRGNVLRQMLRFPEAIVCFDRAIALAPRYAEGHNNRAATLLAMRRPHEALNGFDTALSLNSRYAQAWYNRGIALSDLGCPNDALASFTQAVSIEPDYADAWNKCGVISQELKRFEEAIACYQRAWTLRPGYGEALRNIASALCESDRIAEGFAVFTQHAQLLAGDMPAGAFFAHKLLHDAEQSAYLADQFGLSVNVPGALHLADGSRLQGLAVNPLAVTDITAWATASPQLIVIDDFLTAEALEKLRHFCLGSTVWRKAYKGGYLGALPEHGFACPLLAQIAEELRSTYPAIFGAHALHYLWGFKYDSRLSGIQLHADKAAVNVNFWLTPDGSNLDPASGGLVVWDVAAPRDWTFQRYNGDTEAGRDFLRQNGAKAITIPYKANRAVIFDSDLFHETDRVDFKDSYIDRRINVTLLYGRRTTENR